MMSKQTTPRKVILFRAGLLIFFAAVAVIGSALILIKQDRLVIESPEPRDGDSGLSVRFQDAPIYVEEPDAAESGHRYLYDETLGWKNIPGWNAKTVERPLKINSKGLRDHEYDYAKPEGVRRVFVLGDSFTWGYGVGNDQIYTEVLERGLAGQPPVGSVADKWEVLNAGVSGWGTDQEFLFLINEGFKYEPDIVVLAFYLMNDPANNASSLQYGLHKPVFANLDLQLTNVPAPKPGSGAPEIRCQTDPLSITMALISEMSRACRQRAVPLAVMKFGLFEMPEEAEDIAMDKAWSAAIKLVPGIHYFDLDAAFFREKLDADHLSGGMKFFHWNPKGHQAVARLLRGFLESEKLL